MSPPPLANPVSAGKLTFAMPDSESVVVAATWNPPDFPACALMNTGPPETNELPVAADNVNDGTLGAVVSTLTTVWSTDTLPTWSVPVNVYR